MPANPLIPSVFHEPWWLDAVTNRQWQEVTVNTGTQTVARLPFVLSQRWWLPTLIMPPLTHSLGPAIDEGQGSSNTRALRRLDLTEALLAQLPTVDHVGLCCHRGVSEVLAFQARGFASAPQFTVEIAPAPQDQLWANLRDKTRNVIRRCQQTSTVVQLDDPQEFVRFYLENLQRQQRQNYFLLNRVEALYEACAARGRVQLLGVQNTAQQLLGAAMIVNDEHRSYYLLTTRRPDVQDNGVISLLIWEALCHSAARGRTFDFDGIASEGASRFYAGFGGQLAPRYVVRKSSRRFMALRVLRNRLKFNDRNHYAPIF